MKNLLETIFAFAFVVLFFTFLPTIIGIVALGAFAWFIYSMLADSSFGDSNQNTISEKRDTYNNQEKTYETKRESGVSNSSSNYSGNHNYSYHHSYDVYEDSYYDDRYDQDMPPEEGDGFRGTGAPFL